MSSIVSTKSVCVVDDGLFVELAVTLAKSFGKVYYYSPWKTTYPTSNDLLVGSGFPGVTKLTDFWGAIDDIDLFVFPTVYLRGWQKHLRSLGKRVFGSGESEILELHRSQAKEIFKKLGLPVGDYECVVGIDNLRKYLKSHKDVWVKVNVTRGDCETFHALNYDNIEPYIDSLEYNLGAKKNIIEFIVEKSINNAVETGYDGYCIDGQFPLVGLWGMVHGDSGYVGTVVSYDRFPDPILFANERLRKIFKALSYRNFFSTELFLTSDRRGYMSDPCCRMGSPPGEIYQLMFSNLAEIIWYGSEGQLVDPVVTARCGGQMALRCEWADKNWLAVHIPDKIKDNIKLRYGTRVNGKYYVVPQFMNFFDMIIVVATGDSWEEVIARIYEYSDMIEGFDIPKQRGYFDKIFDRVNEAKEKGIYFEI